MTNASSIPLADRVTRYLLRRLERQAIRAAYEAAEANGLLERHFGSDEMAPDGPICWHISATVATGAVWISCGGSSDHRAVSQAAERSFA